MKQEVIEKFGFTFIAPSPVKKNKKYAVYHDGVYLCSFGQLKPSGEPFTQYHDRIGVYSDYNNNNIKKREQYQRRHVNDKAHLNDITAPAFWSWFLLW